MKKLLLSLLICTSAQAIELKFIGPCDEAFIMKTEVTEEYQNLGELTVETLKKFGIPFQRTEEGLASAFETPVGKDAVEVISDVEARAYGWCYSVDGASPEVYPNEVFITPETKSIVWHYGYSTNLNGQWITQCLPAWKVKPAFLCEDPQPSKPVRN